MPYDTDEQTAEITELRRMLQACQEEKQSLHDEIRKSRRNVEGLVQENERLRGEVRSILSRAHEMHSEGVSTRGIRDVAERALGGEGAAHSHDS